MNLPLQPMARIAGIGQHTGVMWGCGSKLCACLARLQTLYQLSYVPSLHYDIYGDFILLFVTQLLCIS